MWAPQTKHSRRRRLGVCERDCMQVSSYSWSHSWAILPVKRRSHPILSCWCIARWYRTGYLRRSTIPYSIQSEMAEAIVSWRLKHVLVFVIFVLSALIRPQRHDVRLGWSQRIMCWVVSSSLQRGHLLEECIPNRWSWRKVGSILLHIFVRSTSRSILLMARARDFQANPVLYQNLLNLLLGSSKWKVMQ